MRTALVISALSAFLAAFAVSPCLAEPMRPHAPLVTDQDPLMRQIMHRHLRQANGGITAVVRVATGQSIALQVVELKTMSILGGQRAVMGPSAGDIPDIKPSKELLPAKEKPASKKKKVTQASEQLKALKKQGEKQGW